MHAPCAAPSGVGPTSSVIATGLPRAKWRGQRHHAPVTQARWIRRKKAIHQAAAHDQVLATPDWVSPPNPSVGNCAGWRVWDHTSVHSGDGLHHGDFGRLGLAGTERHQRSDEDEGERDGHRRPHRIDERVHEDRVRDLGDLRREIG
jgi:hypothetical protein